MTDTPEAVRLADDFQALRDALEANPKAWQYDSNQTPFYNDIDGYSRGGECDGTYCLFGGDFTIDGEAYEGPTLSERCSKADAHFISAANPETIRALLARLDSAEAERDQLRAELEKVRLPDVDDLAQFIRWVSGNNKMGAGVLAERITEWLAAPNPTPRRSERTVMIQELTIAAKQVINHWQEFGPESGFDEIVYRLEKALSATQPSQAAQSDGEDTPEHKAYRRGFGHGHDMGRVSAEQAIESDGRGTDAQIEKERDIARHAIVGSLAAGYAGQAHPGTDHWLAAAHEAGARIKELEAQAVQPSSEDVRELSKWLNEGNTSPINRQALARVLHAAQGAQGEPEGVEYFAYSDEMGFETFKTRDEAIICAQESITIARSEARHDGEWSDDVSTIRWGVTIAKAQEVELDVHEPGDPPCVDYVLTASTTPPAQPAVAQGAGEVVGEVDTMPGTTGFTMACFRADEVPVGTKLYTHPTPAQPAPVVPDVQREIAAALALFPADLPGQTFRVGGYNNGQALEADNDTQFFSKKRVIALLEKLRGHLTAAATPTPPAQEAKSAFTKALEIRTAQGWKLTGEAIPVLYTDTINDQQVMRDDVWLCTTDALKPAQAAADARDAFERWYVTHIREQIEMACTQQEITELREGDAYGDRAYLNGAWYGYQAALATHQQGGSK